MKTLKIIVSLLLLGVALLPVSVFAQTGVPTMPSINITDLDSLYAAIASLLWQVAAIIAVVIFVIAGIMFMLAQGDPAKVATARMMVLWGVVGVVVAVIAFTMIEIIGSVFSS